MKVNLHTHTRFSDGSSDPEDYVKAAIRQGFDKLGFSDHAPVPFKNNFAISDDKIDEYVSTILSLKKRYTKPTILLALEADYIPGITTEFDHFRKSYPLDYLIGSVHLVKGDDSGELWFIDGPDISVYDEGLKNIFSGDGRKAVTAYYSQIQEMVATQKPEIIGHLDKIKMYNHDRYFLETDPWYQTLVDKTLDVIQKTGGTIEINTRGIYKKRSDTLFPGPEILKKIHQRGLPVIISSDAHKPDELGLGFEGADEEGILC